MFGRSCFPSRKMAEGLLLILSCLHVRHNWSNVKRISSKWGENPFFRHMIGCCLRKRALHYQSRPRCRRHLQKLRSNSLALACFGRFLPDVDDDGDDDDRAQQQSKATHNLGFSHPPSKSVVIESQLLIVQNPPMDNGTRETQRHLYRVTWANTHRWGKIIFCNFYK